MRTITFLVLCMIFASATAFLGSFARLGDRAVCKLQMADVDLVFPGNKKCKAASGSLMKDGNYPTCSRTEWLEFWVITCTISNKMDLALFSYLILCLYAHQLFSILNQLQKRLNFLRTMAARKGNVAHVSWKLMARSDQNSRRKRRILRSTVAYASEGAFFENSRRTAWPFHIHNPVRTSRGKKTNRVGVAYWGMSSNGL